jgi:hypothetical protein
MTRTLTFATADREVRDRQGTVGHDDLSAPHPHGGRRPNGLEGMSNDEVTARPEQFDPTHLIQLSPNAQTADFA